MSAFVRQGITGEKGMPVMAPEPSQLSLSMRGGFKMTHCPQCDPPYIVPQDTSFTISMMSSPDKVRLDDAVSPLHEDVVSLVEAEGDVSFSDR